MHAEKREIVWQTTEKKIIKNVYLIFLNHTHTERYASEQA